ncbi:MAG TPA: EAL domain-containing protein [Rhodocyclaceae bacterium]|nr:EAL domain-containing protein [Rhodocyclaceae bacterium]
MPGRILKKLRNSYRVLIATTFSLLILATLLVVYLLNQSYQRYTSNAEQTVENITLGLERFLNAHFQESELALQSAEAEFTRLHATGTFTQERFSNYLQSLRQRLPNALSVRGADKDGWIIYGDQVDPSKPFNHANRDYFKRARTEHQLIFGLPVKSIVTGEWLFPIIQPLHYADGSFAGTAYVNTANARINELLESINIGEHGALAIFDSERRVLVRYPSLEIMKDEQVVKVSAPETLAALNAGKTTATYTAHSSLDGTLRTMNYRKVGHFPMYVLAGLSQDDYLRPWRNECWVGGGFIAILAAGTLLLGINVRRYLQAQVQLEALEVKQASHDHLTAIIRAIPDILFEVDIEGRYLDYRSVNLDLLPTPPDEFIGRKVSDILPTEAANTVMLAIAEANQNGHAYGAQIHIQVPAGELWFELSIARKETHRSEKPTFIVLSRDITERNLAQAQIEQLAFSDMLTGLPNRRLFLDRLRQSMAVSDRSQSYRALLFLDIDKFKTLNDTLGHQTGDMLLVQIADRLRHSVREYDTVARLGGDEFVVLLEQLGMHEGEAAAQALNTAEKIADQLAMEYSLGRHKYKGSSSVGIALFRGQAVSSEELLKRADLAMYQAKANGNSAVCFFDPQMQARIEARQSMEEDLKHALMGEEFSLHYQPQIDVYGRLIGAEALIRWHSAKRGSVSPAEFIPLAEESALILPIGHWVMREACQCLEAWQAFPELSNVAISVNVSAKQIALPTFVEEVQELLSFYAIKPSLLKLEITESLLVDKVDEIVAKITALQSIGVSFSLDDFGTGYSSLNYLKRLPFNQVKIDQSFARGVLDNPHDAAICRAIIALGKALHLEVVAEGIETESQWDFFKSEGCLRGQGYLFGRPMARKDFERAHLDKAP